MDGGSPRLISSAYMVLVLVLSVLALAIISTQSGAAADKPAQASKVVHPTSAPLASNPKDAGTVVPLSEGFEGGFGSFTFSSYGCDCLGVGSHPILIRAPIRSSVPSLMKLAMIIWIDICAGDPGKCHKRRPHLLAQIYL